jgi:hypothetical protein
MRKLCASRMTHMNNSHGSLIVYENYCFCCVFGQHVGFSIAYDVVFHINCFAFAAADRADNAYISGIKRVAPLLTQLAKAPRVTRLHGAVS